MISPGRVIHDNQQAVLLGTLLVTAALALIGTSPRHSLTTSAASWTCIWAYTRFRSGLSSTGESQGRLLSWAAGVLLALSSVCERAVERGHIYWAKALLPVLVCVIVKVDAFGTARFNSSTDTRSAEKPKNGDTRLLTVLTVSALVALSYVSELRATFALGCCNAVLVAVVLSLLQTAHRETVSTDTNDGVISVSGLLSQPTIRKNIQQVLVDVSFAAALAQWMSAFLLEGFSTRPFWFAFLPQQILMVVLGIGMVIVHVMLNRSMILVGVQVDKCDQVTTASTFVVAALAAQLATDFSLGRLWFASLCLLSLYVFLHDRTNSTTRQSALDDRANMRSRRLLTLLLLVSLALLAAFSFRDRLIARVVPNGPTAPWSPTLRDQDLSAPLQYNDTHVHPIEYLAKNAEHDFSSLLQRQSRTLGEAVAEYKRRYNIPPPPHFDKWFQFAQDRNVQLIDEFDTIHNSLLPFWGLKPVTIRRRVQEAIGFDGNNLIALMIRSGKVTHVRSGQEWQQKATIGMMDKFIQYLPDMDLAFNIHDEPRVVVPHDELSRLVEVAKDRNMPAAFANPDPKDGFSSRPKDLNSGERVDEVKVTRFNVFAHQPTWIPSRLSCSPNSPARALEEETTPDNVAAYAMSELGFVYNDTAFSDVCNSPSFGTSHGFFDRPNAFNVVHDLVPIFSQSKMSSFQDILYPSPWYWYGKVTYDEHKDLAWDKKESKLWWVGSTTGGFSRDGGWRRQHRQKLVRALNAPDQAKIMYDAHLNSASSRDDNTPDWQMRSVARSEYSELMDVHFSHVGQCDPGDCDAQKEFFKIVAPADQQDAWKYKYLLDMDGNAFSGRFYAFLKSHSLVFKMAVFREWHAEWLKPWIHYVPLSLRAEEALESVRYFGAEELGKNMAIEMAERGREWSNKVLRNEDFEVWFFRLLLEYGRLVDDNRESIGFGA
ncbi:hypothetical protein D6D15_09330 [Aureobasidium pullulans]|uniref:Glycosyl transferase CAP10 domain-containing protein n=1 Tax=Aureobasidium pullulans TaxID=5580 RepID=A0A4S9AVG7_AURPU|nr:hypothetical protein D6D15_09330 [Aureobasidium pullulans]